MRESRPPKVPDIAAGPVSRVVPRSTRIGWFWLGCLAISVGVILHLPMLVAAHGMGNRLAGMPVDAPMPAGMGLIGVGVILACWGALPGAALPRGIHATSWFEVRDGEPLNRSHATAMAVLMIGLVIDVMKPATLGFVLPGLAKEYGIERSTAALLPLVALTGTAVGLSVWGWLADANGRRVSILLSAILFASTSICGAMPAPHAGAPQNLGGFRASVTAGRRGGVAQGGAPRFSTARMPCFQCL
jgi:putative MFS transporter